MYACEKCGSLLTEEDYAFVEGLPDGIEGCCQECEKSRYYHQKEYACERCGKPMTGYDYFENDILCDKCVSQEICNENLD